MRLGRLFFAGAVFLGLAYFALRSPLPVADPRFIKEDFPGPGAALSISVYLDTGYSRDRAHKALADCAALLREREHDTDPWGDGALGAMNRSLARGGTPPTPPDLVALFERAEQSRVETGGRYDARLGALSKLWGFDGAPPSRNAPPPEAEVQRAVAALARAAPWRAGAYGPSLAVQFDFGGLARASALDEALATLKDAGINNVMLNFGGSLRTRGARGNAPWRIGLRNPRAKGPNDVLAYVLTDRDEALTTRGDDELFFEQGGARYHHILDPRSGAPAQGLQSATVISADGQSAAVAAQALFVAGPGGWRDLARQLGADQALVVTADGDIKLTAALNQRLKFLHDRQPSVVK